MARPKPSKKKGYKNPFAEIRRTNKLPWTKIEEKGMGYLLDHCLRHSDLPQQV